MWLPVDKAKMKTNSSFRFRNSQVGQPGGMLKNIQSLIKRKDKGGKYYTVQRLNYKNGKTSWNQRDTDENNDRLYVSIVQRSE